MTKDELTAAAILDVITELKEGRIVQQDQLRTLVQILEGQTRIEERLDMSARRSQDLEREIRRHAERISALENPIQ